MAEVSKVVETSSVETIEKVKLTVEFTYVKKNGEFESADDKAHYEKYVAYKDQIEG